MRQVEVSRTIVFDAPAPGPGVLRGADRRQPRHRPPRQRRDHLRPPHPPRHPRRLPHCHRPPRRRPGRRRGRAERLLQALAGQAVPQGRPGDADRDRHQRPPRPGLQRPPAQPGRASGQGPCGATAAYWMLNAPARAPSSRVQPLSGSRTRPLTADGRRTPALRFGDPRVMALAGALCSDPARRHRHHQQEPARLDDRTARTPPTAAGQMTYDLRRLRLHRADPPDRAHQPLRPHPRRHHSSPSSTPSCTTGCCARSWPPTSPRHPAELRAALRTIDQHIDALHHPAPGSATAA